ncbi:DNA-protecting protein DprA [Candidatus Desantisbacteria bacterium CG_4_10_14_0_8_um_filter_39_17]|uniref:DNA-protecting protein DprA n=2 Tax=unclassified Candidatus Desantisiibacteriota TaxID=3106372 RepID=A0A2H9PBJ1_9BACT|nr:MAG: DNA-protecting protein DprA [Candidatus Desantisbacteria bacterium CG_4_10_14_0_8_um_filter_39_17]
MSEEKYSEQCMAWISLNMAGIGSSRLKGLLQFFGSPDNIFGKSAGELKKVEGIGDEIARKILSLADGKAARRELERAKNSNIQVFTLDDEDYPFLLKQIYDPPIVLYAKGKFLVSDKNSIGIVGSRRPSIQGRLNAEKLALELASRGWTVVSGMARGVDTAAHRGVLKAKGRTIAVLGSGLNVVYPPENKGLMLDIERDGMVISEFPLGTLPDRENFPRRNRVISGLSLGIVVVEAAEKSGALITASFALEQGREVFAVPGNVNLPTTRGCHQLIKDGAKLVQGVEDILEELTTECSGSMFQSDCSGRVHSASSGPEEKNMPLSEEEAKVYKLMGREPVHIDELTDISGMESHKVGPILIKMEIRGLIRQLPGKLFVRK